MKAADQVAEALTDVAEDLKKASDGFDSYYDGAHEHLAADKTLPKDGDFLTGRGRPATSRHARCLGLPPQHRALHFQPLSQDWTEP